MLTFQAGQQMTRMVVRLFPSSVISGRVVDADGEPVADARVQALPVKSASGGARSAASAMTNDLGEYRVHSLVPGDYYVMVTPTQSSWGSAQVVTGTSTIENYVRTFYPQSNERDGAYPVTVHLGEEVPNIDVQLVKLPPRVVKTVDLTTVASTSYSVSSDTSAAPSRNSNSANAPLVAARPGVVAGQVVDSFTDGPVARAHVVLRSSRAGQNVPYVAETDAAGHFTIKDVEPGRYRITAVRAGFSGVAANSGTAVAGEVSVSPKQRLEDVLLRLTPSAVIAGRVVDEYADPVADLRVEALRYNFAAGTRQLQLAATTVTDDRGEYRLHGLPPGTYYIQTLGAANSQATRELATAAPSEEYASTFYPRTTDVTAASAVSLTPGEQAGGINIVAIETRPGVIRGRVVGVPLATGTVLTLAPADTAAQGFSAATTASVKDSQGHFEIRGVLPGTYRISAMLHDKHAQYAGSRSIEIKGTNLSDVLVGMNRAAELPGRIRIEGDQKINLKTLHVLLTPESQLVTGTVLALIKPDSTFVLPGVFPEKYEIKVIGMSDAFYVKALQVGNEAVRLDSADFSRLSGPVNIVLSSNSGTITGSVLDQDQRPHSAAKVVLVPDNRDQHDLYKVVTSSELGQFKITGVAPGRYELFAMQQIAPDAYFDPDFLASIDGSAQSVIVGENTTASAVLQVIQEQ